MLTKNALAICTCYPPIQAGIMPMQIRIRGILNWPTKREKTLQYIIWPLLWDVYKL